MIISVWLEDDPQEDKEERETESECEHCPYSGQLYDASSLTLISDV